MPGDPIEALAGDRPVPPAVRAELRHRFHLDDPLVVQYGKYLGGLAHGDFGQSFKGRDVAEIMRQRFPVTLRLALLAFAFEAVFGLVAGILAGVLLGVAVGAINGSLTVVVGIPSFLVTLGMLGIAHGTAQWITDSAPQPILNDTYNLIFGTGNFGPIPGLIVWSAIFVAVGAVILAKTRFGRQVLATGGNRVAAEFTGVNTRRIKFSVLLLCSMCAAVAGMLYAGRLQSGRFQWGTGDELSAIAAVILGGTSLFGGSGTIVGTLFGALLIGLVNNGLILAGLDVSQQQVVRGAIIILAVALARRK